jgi:hypothetical protein
LTQGALDFQAARARRDEALTRVEASAGTWVDEAYAFLVAYAREHAEVFCDSLWAAGLRRPSNPKALGSVMQRAARAGVIAKVGYRPSVYSNLAPKPLWASLVYRGQP